MATTAVVSERAYDHDIELDQLKRDSAIPRLFMQYVPSLRAAGSSYIGRCPQPDHRDLTPSFSLFQGSDGTWLGKCHGCRDAINIYQLLQLHDISFPEAKKIVKEFLGRDTGPKIVDKTPSKKYNKAASVLRFGEAEAYLKEHGVSAEVARLHDVGVDDLVGLGPCITFPYDDTNVKLRGLRKKEFRHYPGTSTAGLIYNVECLRENPKELFITESERDCLMMVSHGFPAISVSSASACMNSDGSLKFSAEDVAKVRQIENIYIAVDQDDAGRECAAALQQAIPHAKMLTWTYRGSESGDAKDVGEIFTNDPGNFSARITQLCLEAPEPKTIEQLFEAPAAPAPDEGKDPAFIKFSDAGNGELLVVEHGDRIRYVNDERGWRIWDGVRWNADKTQEIARLAKQTVRRILEKAVHADSLDMREALAKWSLGCESRSRLENMVVLASREQKVATNSCYFDVSPWLFNCGNGTIDLETNTFRTANRNDLLSKRSPVSYDPKARCPMFDAFLGEILPSPEIRKFLQASLGYTLCGHAWEKYVWFLIGEGDNGKTVLIETIRYVFGDDDYATNMNFNSLLHREGQGPSGDIARLRGARFVSACESDQGQKISPALLKRLSGGGDKITASFKYRDEFEFVPTHKLWLATNHPPQLAAEDDALWRRIARVPFNVRIPLERQDSELGRKLRSEGSGILNWMFDGWKAYREKGLKLPAEVREETERYRDASDVCKDFLVDRVVSGGGSIGSTRLYQAFKSWFGETHNQRQQPMSQKMFSTRLDQLGYHIEKKRDGNVFCGIGSLLGDPIPEQGLF